MGSSTVMFIQIASPRKDQKFLFKGLYLKIRTYLRAAQKAFLPTCQELLEVSLCTSETGQLMCSRGQLLAIYPAILGRLAKKAL